MVKKLRLDADRAAVQKRMEAGEQMGTAAVWKATETGTYKWAYATLSNWPRCLATGGTVKDGCAPKEQAMKNKHTPMLRLRSAPVGSIVALPAIRRHKSFYLGGRDADGYSYLWASKGAKDDGLHWLVMAAGSHEVVMA